MIAEFSGNKATLLRTQLFMTGSAATLPLHAAGASLPIRPLLKDRLFYSTTRPDSRPCRWDRGLDHGMDLQASVQVPFAQSRSCQLLL